MKKTFLTLLTFLLLIVHGAALAIEQLQVQGLFGSKVVLMVDGKRHVLAAGKVSPEGVKVILVNKKGAVLEVDGEQKQYDLGSGSTISASFTERKSSKETIYKNSGGMYLTYGNINGRSVYFLVDTGASAVAMNTVQAKNLGLQYERYGTPTRISTASGFENGYRLRLKSVTVGNITEKNVMAMVIDGKHPGPILLGMTFLGRLNVEHSGNAMTLLQKQ